MDRWTFFQCSSFDAIKLHQLNCELDTEINGNVNYEAIQVKS